MKTKNILIYKVLIFLISITLFSCQTSRKTPEPYSLKELKEMFDEKKPLDKKDKDANFIYSLGYHGEYHLYSIGYVIRGDDGLRIWDLKIEPEKWQATKNKIIKIIEEEENLHFDKILFRDYSDQWPSMIVKINSYWSIKRLHELDEVRSIESKEISEVLFHN